MLDTVIIGSGPAGISAAIYAKRANLSVLVIEKEFEGTGQIANTERVDNYPGIFGIGGYELGEQFREHALKCEVEFKEAEVTAISRQDNGVWLINTSEGELVETKTVIYAAGARHRRLEVAEAEKFEGRGLSVCALCDGAFYKNKSVAVIGGGNSAVEAAIYLSNIASKVYLVHRRDSFRADEVLVESLKNKENIELVLNVTPIAIEGKDKVEGLELSDNRRLEVQGIFSMIGMVPNTEVIKNLEVTDAAGYIVADETGITKQPGFFAAGDVRTKSLRQVVTAVADGANAAVSVSGFINANV